MVATSFSIPIPFIPNTESYPTLADCSDDALKVLILCCLIGIVVVPCDACIYQVSLKNIC